MKKVLLVAGYWLLVTGSYAQTVTQRLQKAFQQFESDSQLKHAISSLYVIDAATGQVIFDKNSLVGLAGASTQKIITAATAFELLGKEYRYKTEFGRCTGPEKELGLWIGTSGDPTFGSWRWESTKEKNVLDIVINEIEKIEDFKNYKSLIINATGWNAEQIPDGWIWQDIGNYYGAGSGMLNWRENQYDLFLKSGSKIGDAVSIVETSPVLYSYNILSETISAAKGSGDNAYIYLPAHGVNAVVRGTIPVNEDRFRISGSMMNPGKQFVSTIEDSLKSKLNWTPNSTFLIYQRLFRTPTIFYTHYSPSLDSIIYWFLKKSINLYGEALIKTFAYEKQGFGSTDSGVAIVKKFWKDKGLDEDELNIYDGSGLSPLNRITTHAQVEILKYAKTKDWFRYFFDALPEFNDMKMKSGTINDVKGFCGFHKTKDGKEYIFSFLVNNYNGKTSGVVNKMYKVLDELK
jgi:D-alanyl-D-alanine carboxypeptidase/D-alanyl-D-alanine-endopeptidase (penicillin-binding protein 4)